MRNIIIFKRIRNAISVNKQRARAIKDWKNYSIQFEKRLIDFDNKHKTLNYHTLRYYREHLINNINIGYSHIARHRDRIRQTNRWINKIPFG